MISIDKNVPLPPPRANHNKYPWNIMQVGDSFIIPQESHSAYSNAYRASERYAPKRFVCRQVKEGYRIWRTA